MKKLTIIMAVLVFTLVFATSGYAAGMLGGNNGTSSTTSTDNTGSGSVLGGNRMGTTGNYGTMSTPPASGIYGSYNTTTSTPSTYGGTDASRYNTNGTMRGYNYRTNATTTDNDMDWGWLGLLGLLGLIGLRKTNDDRHREHSGK